MRICPKCKREWPDQANFCPMDGTVMAAETAPPPTTPAPRSKAARPGAATRVVQDAMLRATPSVQRRASPSPVHEEPARALPTEPDVSDTPTVAEMPAVVLPEQRVPAAADTLETPSSADAPTEELREPSAEAEPGKHFSETAWFMAATDIETMEEVDEDVDVTALEEKYVTEGRHSTQVRKQFSLTMTNLPAAAREVVEEARKKGRKPKDG